MKKSSTIPESTIEKLLLTIQEEIKTLDHNQKVANKEIDNTLKDLRLQIFTESASTRIALEKTLRAEIQIGNDGLRTELEKRFTAKLTDATNEINKRITHVGDLITIQLGNKIKNHEKRITNLEHVTSAA